MTLSGGMKRRVMIAKALSHEPEILFLDEPTAGVDVELRRDMWALVRTLRQSGVTIILTTHYIDEAEEMADRGRELEYTFRGNEESTGIPILLERLGDLGIGFKDLNTRQSSLEDIFVSLVSDRK
jgi:ABC-2 type transport system ATP-binding protein